MGAEEHGFFCKIGVFLSFLFFLFLRKFGQTFGLSKLHSILLALHLNLLGFSQSDSREVTYLFSSFSQKKKTETGSAFALFYYISILFKV